MKKEQIKKIYNKPLIELIFEASLVHKKYHNIRELQISSLISIKTGGCPEDCAYCPQAARYFTNIEKNDLMSVSQVKNIASNAKKNGASRVCLGAAWRNVENDKNFDTVLEMVKEVTDMDMEVCCTLGMITESQAKKLAEAGLYAYNHNLDSSQDYYKKIISTRSYNDRLKTINNVRKSGVTVCCGGIIGMGESLEDRISMLETLSNLNPQPESVPINALVPVEGTPMAKSNTVSTWDMVRMIATTRIALPKSTVRLSAGRNNMSKEAQTLCFIAGASSIFMGDKLLTTPNPRENEDKQLMDILGFIPKKPANIGTKATDVKSNKKEYKYKWQRPNHIIKENVQAAKEGRKNRKIYEKNI